MNKRFCIFVLIVFFSHFLLINAQSKSKSGKPVLVIQVVIEQMRVDMLDRYWDSFSEKGFKRLVNEGAFCRNAFYDYMVTESAPGYATLVTGNNPSGHGIISDSWYLRLSNREQNCVSDPLLADKPAFPAKNKYSPKLMIGSTIGDELRISNYKLSKVISISDKPLASVLSAGNIGNAAFWIDEETGNWTSSPYYMDSIPKWAREFNNKKFASFYLTREWTPLNSKSSYKESLSDNNSYESGFSNKQKTFPYKLSEISVKDGMKALKYTPFGNTYTIDFAISAIMNENLGKDNYPDLLTISFGSPGNVCDLFGIRSMELQDIYLRLDYDIAHLLEFIDDNFGKDNVLVVLTSDRGASDNNEFMGDLGMPVGKFFPAQSISLLESYLKALYGQTGWVKYYSDKQVYLNDLAIDKSNTPVGEVQMKAAQFLAQFQGVANATTGYLMQTNNFEKGDLLRFQNSYNLVRSGDILISLKPGYVEVMPATKANPHEKYTAYRYNAHVPLIFYGCSIKHKVIEDPISIIDVAPTISRILGIPFPNSAKGQAIEVLLNE
jgi:predicted AlkP superfamily pyrophosphatase or phosphodiesterase